MNKTEAAKYGLARLGERVCIWGIAATFGFFGAGCHTPGKSAADQAAAEGIAAIRIHGNTPGQITEVATQVFREHGYTRGSRRSGTLIFEKQGSKLNDLAYGSWTGDIPVWMRVKLAIIPTGEAEYTVQCNAYRVLDKGSATEEEVKISKLSGGPYKKLLEEIAARFRGANASKPAVSGTKE